MARVQSLPQFASVRLDVTNHECFAERQMLGMLDRRPCPLGDLGQTTQYEACDEDRQPDTRSSEEAFAETVYPNGLDQRGQSKTTHELQILRISTTVDFLMPALRPSK